MLLSVADRMSSTLNASQQDPKVSGAPVICSMGMLGTRLTMAEKLLQISFSHQSRVCSVKGHFSAVDQMSGFCLLPAYWECPGNSFCLRYKTQRRAWGYSLTVTVDFGLLLTHPQEPRISYISVGQGDCTMQHRNWVLKLWFLCCNEH